MEETTFSVKIFASSRKTVTRVQLAFCSLSSCVLPDVTTLMTGDTHVLSEFLPYLRKRTFDTAAFSTSFGLRHKKSGSSTGISNYMDHRPYLEANRSSATQEISWYPKVHSK